MLSSFLDPFVHLSLLVVCAMALVLGMDLYKRMLRLGTAMVDMSSSLEKHLKKHNERVGTLEGSVLPHARKMKNSGSGSPLGMFRRSPYKRTLCGAPNRPEIWF